MNVTQSIAWFYSLMKHSEIFSNCFLLDLKHLTEGEVVIVIDEFPNAALKLLQSFCQKYDHVTLINFYDNKTIIKSTKGIIICCSCKEWIKRKKKVHKCFKVKRVYTIKQAHPLFEKFSCDMWMFLYSGNNFFQKEC